MRNHLRKVDPEFFEGWIREWGLGVGLQAQDLIGLPGCPVKLTGRRMGWGGYLSNLGRRLARLAGEPVLIRPPGGGTVIPILLVKMMVDYGRLRWGLIEGPTADYIPTEWTAEECDRSELLEEEEKRGSRRKGGRAGRQAKFPLTLIGEILAASPELIKGESRGLVFGHGQLQRAIVARCGCSVATAKRLIGRYLAVQVPAEGPYPVCPSCGAEREAAYCGRCGITE